MTCPRCAGLLLRDGTCLTHGEPSSIPVAEPITPREARRKWTEDEKARVIALAADPTITGVQLAALVGRSHKGLKHQLSRLAVSKTRAKSAPRKARTWATARPHGRWTEDELTALETQELRLLIRSRSSRAVVCQASRLGSPLRSGDGCYSLRQVSVQYGVRYPTVHGWVGRGLLPAKRSGDMWRIEPAVADRVIPILKKATRANHGRKGWWTK